ncbi:MFS transporter [Nocardioides alkalitolerans]|uniref:MFS transporter n=1 Tax=Nocardioides alkalitolerans TaxID=281714 RepID=UPI0004128134|nr:MFS transporter [Nocardioides alkalitolerans]
MSGRVTTSRTEHAHEVLPAAPPRKGSLPVTYAVLTVAVSAFTLLQSMVVPVLATIADELETDQATVTWVLTAYLLSAAICTPLVGRIGDVVGKQRMLVFTLVALSVGSMMAALSPSVGWLIAARVIQGVGGGVLPLAFGIIRDEFAERHRGTALSVVASLASVGFGVGIVVSGPIVGSLGYAWLFWLPMIATGLAAVAAWRLIPPSPLAEATKLPLVPALLLAAWLVALLLGISRGNEWGWASPQVIALLTTAAVLAVVWMLVETRVPVPMIDMAMMRHRGVWTSNLVGACVGFGMYSSLGFLPQFLQAPPEAGYGFGATVTESGHFILPSAGASFLMGFVAGWLVHKLGARYVIAAGCGIVAVSFFAIAFWHSEPWQIYAWMTLQGVGNGVVFSSLAGVVIASVSPSQTGVAGGMNMNIRTIGGSIGTAVMAGIVTSHIAASGLPDERGYVIGFVMIAVAMVVATLVAFRIPNLHDAVQEAPDPERARLAGRMPARL